MRAAAVPRWRSVLEVLAIFIAWAALVALLAMLAGCGPLLRGTADGVTAGATGGAPPSPSGTPAAGGTGVGWLDALLYTGAGLLAYTVGSVGKGYLRSKFPGREPEGDA